MQHRRFRILAVLGLALLCMACEDSAGPDLGKNRYVYYAVGGTNSTSESGFFRYNVDDGTKETIDGARTEYCTPVAANGIVLFEVSGQSQRLYGFCEEGSIIPVPFPQSPDPTMEFVYRMPPRVDLAANGHHAAYAVDLVPAGIQNPSFRRSHLVVFNCAQWKMTLVDIDSLLVDYYTANKVSAGFIAGEHLFMDRTGTRVWFTAGLLGKGSPADTIGYTLAEWSVDGLKILESVAPDPLQPLMYNDYTGTLLYQFGQDGYTVRGQSAPVPYTGDVVSLHPWQFGNGLDISVRWDNDGISIHKATDGTFVWRIAELEQFEAMGNLKYSFTNGNYIAISPDGNWLVLTLTRAENPSQCDLYTLRSNGKDLRRLDAGVPNGFLTISSQITPN